MVPCIANKCLKYPACFHKIRINCPELKEYFNILINSLHPPHTHTETWGILQKDLPNLKSVSEISVRRFGEYEP